MCAGNGALIRFDVLMFTVDVNHRAIRDVRLQMFVLYLPVSRRLDMCVPPRRLRSTGPAVSKHGARDRKQEPAHIYFTSDGVDPRSLDVRTHLMDAKG
eukprot:9270991-Pyramimonas_sp.AAC.1